MCARRAELEALYLENLDRVGVIERAAWVLLKACLARLAQILTKQEETDRRLDAAFRDSSLLDAWTQIKSISYAELVERRQFLYMLQHSVIEPLVAFRVSSDKTDFP